MHVWNHMRSQFFKINLPRFRFFLQLFGTMAMIGVYLFIVAILQGQRNMLDSQKTQSDVMVHSLREELSRVTSEDQFVRNEHLSEEIEHIKKTYAQAVDVYEKLIDLRSATKDTVKLEEKLAESLDNLSKRQWATAAALLAELDGNIVSTRAKIASSFVIPENVPASNAAPASGYNRQKVTTQYGEYLVDMIAADMSSTRIIVDTASEVTCTQDCPALPLATYVLRNGAFAGINGSYFCPADYPSCADKKNSFDTLLMNKDKVYFNSENNVYSTVPAVIFLSGSMRFVGRSLDWGRDTSPDSVIAMQPMLISGGNVVFGGDDDPKKGSKGSRSFVGNKGTTAYIGVVRNATVAEVAHVLKEMGLENALNLDNGGSTALWSGGYKVGPGRNIPNAILFVRK